VSIYLAPPLFCKSNSVAGIISIAIDEIRVLMFRYIIIFEIESLDLYYMYNIMEFKNTLSEDKTIISIAVDS
jgi:hypothetical protein